MESGPGTESTKRGRERKRGGGGRREKEGKKRSHIIISWIIIHFMLHKIITIYMYSQLLQCVQYVTRYIYIYIYIYYIYIYITIYMYLCCTYQVLVGVTGQ